MKRRHERGAVIAETALVVGLLFFFLLAILEFGRIYNVYQVITDAAREGARYASAPTLAGATPGPQAVADYVCNFLRPANVAVPCTAQTLPRGIDCTVQGQLPNDTPAGIYVGDPGCQLPLNRTNNIATNYAEVDIAVPYNFLSLPFGTINIRTRAVMRYETN